MNNTDTEFEPLRQEFLPSIQLTNKEGTPGAYLIGIYLGSRSVSYQMMGEEKKSLVHKFELIETNAPLKVDIEGKVSEVPAIESAVVELWGFGLLDTLLQRVQKGKKVKITYTGRATVAGYPKSLHQVEIGVSKEAPKETVPF